MPPTGDVAQLDGAAGTGNQGFKTVQKYQYVPPPSDMAQLDGAGVFGKKHEKVAYVNPDTGALGYDNNGDKLQAQGAYQERAKFPTNTNANTHAHEMYGNGVYQKQAGATVFEKP